MAVVAAFLAMGVQDASAARAYSAVDLDSLGDMFVVRLSDDGSALRFASIHMNVICRGWVEQELGETLNIIHRRPTKKELRKEGFLRAGKIRRNALTARLYSDWFYTDGTERLRGFLRLRNIRPRSLTAAWEIHATWDPKRGRSTSCTDRRTFRMHRDPGVIFVGDTTDEEPVEIIREEAVAGADVSVGYWAECRRGWSPWGLFMVPFGMNDDGSFGADNPDVTLLLPEWSATWSFQGRFVAEDRAEGRFALTARPYKNPRTCRTAVTWQATTG